jgi:hypothetical protein
MTSKIRIVCVHCGLPEDEHHEFESAMPKNCQCMPGEWVRYVLPICEQFISNGERDPICKRCEHDEACHSQVVTTLATAP